VCAGGCWVTLDTPYKCWVDLSFSNKEPNRWFSENPELAVNFIPNFLMKEKSLNQDPSKGSFFVVFLLQCNFSKGKKSRFEKRKFCHKRFSFSCQKKKISNFILFLFEFFSPHLDSDFSLVASL